MYPPEQLLYEFIRRCKERICYRITGNFEYALRLSSGIIPILTLEYSWQTSIISSSDPSIYFSSQNSLFHQSLTNFDQKVNNGQHIVSLSHKVGDHVIGVFAVNLFGLMFSCSRIYALVFRWFCHQGYKQCRHRWSNHKVFFLLQFSFWRQVIYCSKFPVWILCKVISQVTLT